MVRMVAANYALVTQCLEAGAGGVMGARITSAAHAEEFVRWAKFAPRGLRGMNSSGRDSNYTHKSQAQFAADSNREQLVSIQIETLGALKRSTRSPPYPTSTCCSSAPAISRRSWAFSASSTTPSSGTPSPP